jgi:5,10-methylenetetrahydromethanopterin reductase
MKSMSTSLAESTGASGSQNFAIGFNADVDVGTITRYAIQAEEAGFDSFWLHENAFSRDAISFLNSAALSTSKMRIGVACLSVYTRHPVVLAMSMLTLQETSRGRALLGIGTGFPGRLDLMGVKHDKPIAALKETMDICRKMWNGEQVSLHGKVFALNNVKALAKGSRVPIYIAGWKEQMQSLTGKFADGYVAKGGESPQSLGRIVSGIRTAAEARSRQVGKDVQICAYMLTMLGKSKREALEVARKDPFVNYMLSVQEDYLFEETGINPEKKKPIAENYFKGKLSESSSHVTDEMLDAFTLCGRREDVRERINDYVRSGLDLPILQPISMAPEDVRELISAAETYIRS